MIVIRSKLAPSPIHGLGVFSEEFIPQGSVIWEWHEGIDRRIPLSVVSTLPTQAQEYLRRYGWIENGEVIICLDREQYINHADDPNCIFTADGNHGIAARDIYPNEEITQDYRAFDERFGLKEYGYDWVVTAPQ